MYDGALQDLIDALGRLPGIGPKSAQRIAFYVLSRPKAEAELLAQALIDAKEKIRFCTKCGNIAQEELCSICRNPKRDQAVICVVEEAKDVGAIERTRSYRGLYHVLGGAIDPINGIGPEQLRLRELLTRLSGDSVQEIIIATNPNIEGEATATYLTRTISPLGLKVTRLASGRPVGGDLECADEVTLRRALEGRRSAE